MTTPSAAIREAALLALLPSLVRRISSALEKSPFASVKAFLHSIIGASVRARNSATMPAVIAVMFYSFNIELVVSFFKFNVRLGLSA